MDLKILDMREFFLRTLGVISLNKRKIHRIMTDRRAALHGVLALVIAFGVHAIPFLIIWGQFFSFSMIASYLSWILSFVLFTLIGPFIANKYFGGHVPFHHNFNALSHIWGIQIIGGLIHIVLVLMSRSGMDHPFLLSFFFYLSIVCVLYVSYFLYTEEFRVSDEDAVIVIFLSVLIAVTGNSVFSSFLT